MGVNLTFYDRRLFVKIPYTFKHPIYHNQYLKKNIPKAFEERKKNNMVPVYYTVQSTLPPWSKAYYLNKGGFLKNFFGSLPH